MAQFSSYSFDVSVLEILHPLICGGCHCVLSEMQRRDGLLVALKDFQVSHLLLTPTVARTIADRDQLSSLQVLALVGEKPTPMDIEIWAGRVHLLNGYGPAECSILSTIHNGITRHDPADKIGFPSGCKCWIVHPNNHERLLPFGAPGELLIGGHLVGRGYLNDEARTARGLH
jgi:non-ribosomal peptide synthetase component F